MEQKSLHDIAQKLCIVEEKTVSNILHNERTDVADLEAIAMLVQEINRRALCAVFGEDFDVSLTGHDEADLARSIGAPTPDEILDAYYEIKAIRDEIVRSIAITTDELFERQAGKHVKTRPHVDQESDVLTPTDGRSAIQPGSGGGVDRPVFQERLATFLLILTDLGIDTQEPGRVRVLIGEKDENMMRKLSYVSVYIPELQRVVDLCNEVGNRSFVWIAEKEDDMEKYWRMTKSEKDKHLEENKGAGQALVMAEGWEERIRALLGSSIEVREKKRDLASRILRKRFKRKEFGERLEELTIFRSENLGEWPKSSSSLGVWLQIVRVKLRDEKLREEEAKALRALGVEPAEKMKTFDQWIKELKLWRSDHPGEWPKKDVSLWQWLQKVRAQLRDLKLSSGEAEALRALGVEPAQKKEDITKTFDEWMEELRSWRSGHPTEWPKEDVSLGIRLRKVRTKFRDGKLKEGEAEALRALGVEPAQKKEDITKTFDEWMEELRSWRSGHPTEWPKEDVSLGMWLRKVRTKLRDEKLSGEEARALIELGVEPAEKNKTFNKRIEELRDSRSKQPTEWPKSNSSLGQWLQIVRVKLRDEKLREEEAEALRALGVEPAQKKEDITKTFDEWIEELKRWQLNHPEKRPKKRIPLGRWIDYALEKLKDGKLSPGEVESLKALGVEPAKRRKEK